MTDDNKIGYGNFIVNNINTSVTIKLNMSGGVLRGNIIDYIPEIVAPPPEPTCVLDSLDFRCQENSQYLRAI